MHRSIKQASTHHSRSSGPNDRGSNSPIVATSTAPLSLMHSTTTASPANSRSFWRQPPQGRADAAPAGRDQGGDGAGLGAQALRVGGVFDVAADVDAAGLVAQRGTDRVVRVRRVGARAHGQGGVEQLAVGHQRSFR
jgi:hypothetical protein